MELAEAAVDKDERRERLIVVEQSLVASLNHLTHAGEVVDAANSFDLKLAIVGLLHRAVFPDDHGGYGFSALDVRNIEALDSSWKFFKGECILQRLLDRLERRLQNSEALIVRLLGVLADKIDERALLAALRRENLDALSRALGQHFGQHNAIGKLNRNKDRSRDVALVEVKLFEQRGEELCRIEWSAKL